MTSVRVNRKAADRVASGHPWIFESDVTEVNGAQAGDAVVVIGPRSQPLGVAHYSAGHWKEAIEALTKSMELQKGKLESFDTFFLAMAHWRLDETEKAREWYDRAVQWMEKNKDQLQGNKQWPEELRRFHAEAEELLEIKKN